MKRKPKFLPFFALGMGIIGFFLRYWLFAGGLDARDLIIATHPANILSYVGLALALGFLFLYLRTLTGKPAYPQLFPKSPMALLGAFAGAAGLLINLFATTPPTVNYILGIAAALGMVLGGILQFQGKRPNVLCHGMVSVYMVLHLISQYKHWSAEPELQEYFFPLLACIFVMLAAYHRATLDNLSGSRKWFAFFNYGSVLLCITALYSENWLFYLSFILWCATCSCSLEPEKEMTLPKNVL